MKKIIILAFMLILTGCSLTNFDSKKDSSLNLNQQQTIIEKTLHDEYIQTQIKLLQKQVDIGEINKEEASQKFKEFLKNLQNLNDGSTQSILKKIELIDPQTAKVLEERIRKNHPEALIK